MGGRRWGSSGRAYGVAVTLLPQKGGAVPESEKRRAAWRINETSHTCWAPPSLSHLLISFPPGRGSGWARGAAWHVSVCACDDEPLKGPLGLYY